VSAQPAIDHVDSRFFAAFFARAGQHNAIGHWPVLPFATKIMPSMKERLKTGKEPLAGFINIIPSAVATQALASAGADILMIDQEHGPIGPESLHAMIASTAGTSCSPWVEPR
jgi:hypothetical protein